MNFVIVVTTHSNGQQFFDNLKAIIKFLACADHDLKQPVVL
jgi:hypothetical protein